MNKYSLTYLFNNDLINNIDLALGRFVQRSDPLNHPWVAAVAALVSQSAARGHVCLDLAQTNDVSSFKNHIHPTMDLTLDQCLTYLKAGTAIGSPDALRPLILDGTRLYLQRLWHYEHSLADSILVRIRQDPDPPLDENHLRSVVLRYFPEPDGDQLQAALTAVRKSICVVSGGPGAGKTYTIARIILILKAMADQKALQIALAAPTGKAAARLQDAVAQALTSLQIDQPSENDQPPKAATLHRLLGYSPSTGRFRYNAEHPLPVDGVIVDEASMVDLGLMARMVAAIPPRARLILVGDKDQLASVEAGAVLGDLCYGISHARSNPASTTPERETDVGASALREHIVVLTHNYRFGSQSGIALLCQAINQGDTDQCLSLLDNTDFPDVRLQPLSKWQVLKSNLAKEVTSRIGPLFQMPSAAEALAYLNRFRFLAVVRRGPFGVHAINAFIEEELRRLALIPGDAGQWYPFRPLMITSNDYFNELFNGDVGMVQRAVDDPLKMAKIIFEDGKGGYRRLAPHQLPPHETVFAMTVHKSQGSEFENVVVVLPDRDVPVLTRELIYTAVTRARKSVTIWGDPELLARAIQRRIQRASGLREALWRTD